MTHVNGALTLGDNIAENGGLKLAYAAYQTFVEQNGPEPILPELNYTANQQFWIAGAQMSCTVIRPEYEAMLYETDVHPSNDFNVIGTLSNDESFSRDFNCPSDCRMNPINKCRLW